MTKLNYEYHRLWSRETIHEIQAKEASKRRLEKTFESIWVSLMVEYLREDSQHFATELLRASSFWDCVKVWFPSLAPKQPSHPLSTVVLLFSPVLSWANLCISIPWGWKCLTETQAYGRPSISNAYYYQLGNAWSTVNPQLEDMVRQLKGNSMRLCLNL